MDANSGKKFNLELLRKFFVIKIAFVFFLLLPSICAALTVTLTWDPVEHEDLAGYEVHWGTTSGVYTEHMDAGAATSLEIEITELGKTYYFAITAYSIWGDVSDYSQEVSAYIGDEEGSLVETQIVALWPVTNARAGGSAVLWAQVKNSAAAPITDDARVWFLVDGPGLASAQWVGSASIKGLAAGAIKWYSYTWSIPSDLAVGTYTYRTQVWLGSEAVSDLSTVTQFAVSKPQTTPSAAQLLAPSGNCAGSTPALVWKTVASSTWYYLWINNANGVAILKKWYTAAEVVYGDVCMVESPMNFSSGTYRYWIQTWNSSGYGPWSSPMTFAVNTKTTPGQSVVLEPETMGSGTYALNWTVAEGSTWYYVWINNSSGTAIFKKWYTASEVVLDELVCSTSKALGAGSYRMWIQAYNGYGYGPWSKPLDFTVN